MPACKINYIKIFCAYAAGSCSCT